MRRYCKFGYDGFIEEGSEETPCEEGPALTDLAHLLYGHFTQTVDGNILQIHPHSTLL